MLGNRASRAPQRPIPLHPEMERAMNLQSFGAIRDRVHRKLLTQLSPTVDINNVVEVRRLLEQIFTETLDRKSVV